MTTQAFAAGTDRRHQAWVPAAPLRSLSSVPAQLGARSSSAPAQVAVAVAGSDPLSREGVVRFLLECPDVHLVADPAESADVVVVVADRITDATVGMLRAIRADSGARIVLVVADLDPQRTAAIMQAGTTCIIRRSDVTRLGLRRLIRSVVAGEAVVPPDVLEALLGRSTPRVAGAPAGVGGLNTREDQVLRLLADGSDTREISHKLCYSERTVKTIIQDVTHRFGLRNRSHAVAYAIRQGLI